MRTEAKVFNLVAAFLYLVGGVYAWWTYQSVRHVEFAGTAALVLSATLAAMCGLYFAFVSRRIPPRPEDRPDADMADGVGDVGFFSPGSYWPLGVGLAAILFAFGLAMRQLWLAGVGLVALLFATGGLLFEYYAGWGRRGD
jgi:hypothetical protein